MKKATFIGILVISVLIALLIGRFFFSEANFSINNPAWNGIMDLSDNVTGLYAIGDLSAASPEGTLLIVGPRTNYTAQEVLQVLSFLRAGGSVVVMDDFGSANSLLAGVDAPFTLRQQPFCQNDAYYHRPAFPVVTAILPHYLTTGVESLVLNHPVTLNVTGEARVVAATSYFAWLDEDDDGFLYGSEKFNQYPVMAAARYGEGELVAIGDPDLFINSMVGLGNNSVLLSNILGNGPVYLDVSHGQGSPPLAYLYHMIKADAGTQVLCIMIIGTGGYWLYRRENARRQGKPKLTRSDQKADQAEKDSIISYMKVKLPLTERDIKEIRRKK